MVLIADLAIALGVPYEEYAVVNEEVELKSAHGLIHQTCQFADAPRAGLNALQQTGQMYTRKQKFEEEQTADRLLCERQTAQNAARDQRVKSKELHQVMHVAARVCAR